MIAVLIALAERVEAASGPDKRLGAEVEIAVRGFPERAYQQRNGARPKGSPDLDRLEWAADWFGAGPTASLDAAMTLVPEGRHTEFATQDRHSLRWKWTLRGGYGVRSEARAATPALAITAAALRAIAARTS